MLHSKHDSIDEKWHWIVSEAESGIKLIAFLSKKLGRVYSSRFIKQLIEKNACKLNCRVERFASTILAKDDSIHLHIKPLAARLNVSVKLEFSRVLYEDEFLIVYNKPPGINCDEKGILQFWKASSVQLVHRLDRDTTGALILAKRECVFKALVEQFREYKVEKYYLAVVDGLMQESRGVVENYLGKKQAYAGQALWGAVSQEQGLYAYTAWKCIKRGNNCSFITCAPKTGRTHQIRVHMAEMNHPILGDFQYGRQFKCSYHPERILLHASEISFNHPVTHVRLHIKAPLPPDFEMRR